MAVGQTCSVKGLPGGQKPDPVNIRESPPLLTRLCGAWLMILWTGVSYGEATGTAFDIALISSDSPRHSTVVRAVQAKLATPCSIAPCPPPANVRQVKDTEADRYLARTRPDLVITVGSAAAREVAELRKPIPTLFGFIPQSTWNDLKDCCITSASTASHVLLDQPATRLLKLARALHPDARTFGILLGPASAKRLPEFETAAADLSLSLETEQVAADEDIGRRLRLLVSRVDVLLALPDRAVYNSSTVYAVLLTTYSARVPVIGFSSALVRAGAAVGLFTSPQNGAEAIVSAVQAYRSTGVFLTDDASIPFSIEINKDVLRSLRLPVVQANELLQLLKESTP